MDMAIKTDKLSTGYGKKIIVDNIDITVRRGEILVLIGPNGSGKSTVLKTISRQLKAISGAVTIDGSDLFKIKESELATRMSILMTKRPNGELMTAWDMVSTGRYPYTDRMGKLRKQDIEAVNRAIAVVELEDIKEELYSQLSDGQKQRVLLARAICQEPDIFILDEPTSFLDIHHKLSLLQILKNMAGSGIAIVMSLHEIDLAQKIADNILCIDSVGKLSYGSWDKIFTDKIISELYGSMKGSYLAEYGSVELERITGEPEVFVIGGGGSGIAMYRKLQRRAIPFAAGILHENDTEYPVAKALASQLVCEEAFMDISRDNYSKALAILSKCKYYICTCEKFGRINEANKQLKQEAEKMGIELWQE